MKQRPRPLLACSTCNNIYCRICLESRWKTDKWAEGVSQGDAWVCPKCVGDCACKACTKGAKAASVRKRAAPSASSSSSSSAAAAADFDLPAPRSSKRASPDVLPGRQPSLPAGFQSAPPKAAQSPKLPRDKMGLSMLLMDANTPLHRKALELARQRERCIETMENMQGLLKRLEQERTVLDEALNDLIKQTTASIGGMSRTASVAQFEEELLVRSPFKQTLPRPSSQCNLEELVQQQTTAPSHDNVC